MHAYNSYNNYNSSKYNSAATKMGMGIGRRSSSHQQMLVPPAGAGTGTGTGSALNTITPCAACKLLRRRCAEECPFSPYFSPHEPHKFAAVHKIFGASNVSKMLLDVPETQRADAANSLVYEANVRLRDPVYGCMGAISALQQQIQSLQAELNAVRAEILRYKYREAAAAAANNSTDHDHIIANSTLMTTTAINAVSMATLSTNNIIAPPATPPPAPPSIVISSSSNTSSSNSTSTSSSSVHLYTLPSSTSGYSTTGTINPNNNVPYFA